MTYKFPKQKIFSGDNSTKHDDRSIVNYGVFAFYSVIVITLFYGALILVQNYAQIIYYKLNRTKRSGAYRFIYFFELKAIFNTLWVNSLKNLVEWQNPKFGLHKLFA